MGLGIGDHLIDGALVQRGLAGDGDGLLFAGGPVFGRHVDNAVGVDVEGDLDLRNPSGGRGQVHQLELAQRLVVRGHLPLALKHMDLHRGLVVIRGGENLGAAGGDGGVALDEASHHTAFGLDAQRQRGHIQQQHVFDLALEHAGLHRRAHGHHLVGVDSLMGLGSGHAGHQVHHRGHPG